MSPYNGDAYLDFPQLHQWCVSLVEAFPEWFELTVLDHTVHQRPILLITVGARGESEHDPRDDRPGFWLDAGTHAAEWTGVMATLYALTQWAQKLQAGDAATVQWFSTHTAYVMPCISVDGYQALHEGAPFMRSTLRPPNEGAVRAGLEPEDLDGDGVVRWMRWKHPAGPFVADEHAPGWIRARRLDDDPSEACFVCPEGSFLQWDGHQWVLAPLLYGLDLNRNFPAHWAPFGMFGQHGGPHPLSEAESRSVVQAFAARPRIGAGLTLHTFTGCLLTQPYRKDCPLKGVDVRLMRRLANQMVEGTGYRVHATYPEFAYDPDVNVVGVWSDSMSTVFGVPAYTFELWDPYSFCEVEADQYRVEPAQAFIDPVPEMVSQMITRFQQVESEVPTFAPWQPYDHPQLGPVEIGGLDHMRTIRNPPVSELPAECAKAFTVIERMRKAIPEVVPQVQVSELPGGLRRVELCLENLGALRTSGLNHGEGLVNTPPVSAELICGEGVTRIEGDQAQALDHLHGWLSSQLAGAGHGALPGLTGAGHRAVARWIVQGDGPLEIRWSGGRGGRGVCSVS
ncbi:MAG: M14 family zinc carboxypeptidase [Bradymonadia bacterium]